MMFTKEQLQKRRFVKKLEKANELATELSEMLDSIMNNSELDEDDENLLNELCDQAESLQNNLFDSFNDEEEEDEDDEDDED